MKRNIYARLSALGPAIVGIGMVGLSAPLVANASQGPSQIRPAPGLEIAPCSDDRCRQRAWSDLLTRAGLSELHAPAGGRAYRWMWLRAWEPTSLSYVEVAVSPSGQGTIRSNRQPSPKAVDPSGLAAFESALAKSEFALAMPDKPLACLDECQDQLLEMDSPAGYHYVARPGGITERGVYEAAVMLERLSAH